MPFLESKPCLHYVTTGKGIASPLASDMCTAKSSGKPVVSGHGLFVVCVPSMAVGGNHGAWGVEQPIASTFPPQWNQKTPISLESCKPVHLPESRAFQQTPCASPARTNLGAHFSLL